MFDPGSYPVVNGSFPSVTTINNTTPTSNDGTPIKKLLADEIFGFFQAVASQGGITPSGSNDVYNDSDLVNGIRNIAGGPGEIVLYGGDLDTLYASNKRLLVCHGQTVLIASYQELVDATYRGDFVNGSAKAFYKTSDSDGLIRNVAGPYFVLPDMRGRFIRGFDGTSVVDPDLRTYWQEQDSAIKEHTHHLREYTLGGSYYAKLSAINYSGSGSYFLTMNTNGSEVSAQDFTDENEYETRPINQNPVICVRY